MPTVKIPLTFIDLHGDGYHIKIRVKINNVPAQLILDTGASTSVFDRESFVKIHPELVIRNSDQLTTGLGTSSMLSYKTTIPLLSIGSIQILNLETALLDLSHINAAYSKISHEPIIGVLGNDILVSHKAIIDYPQKLLFIEEPEKIPGLIDKILTLLFGR